MEEERRESLMEKRERPRGLWAYRSPSPHIARKSRLACASICIRSTLLVERLAAARERTRGS
jgi:hypothetical protein